MQKLFRWLSADNFHFWRTRRFINRFIWRGRLVKPANNLPKGTKYWKEVKSDPDCVIMVQQSPQRRSILYANPPSQEVSHKFLVFPYTVFIIYYQKDFTSDGKCNYKFLHLQVGFSKISINHPSDVLFKLPLSNYEGNFPLGVCMGGGFPRCLFSSLVNLVHTTISTYWQSEFTAMNKKVLDKWHHKTQNNQPINELMQSIAPVGKVIPTLPKTKFIDG